MTDRTAAGRSVRILKHRRAIGTIAAAVLLLSVLAAWVYGKVTGGIPEGQAYFYFFDVGQADAAAIVTRDVCVLIDAGSCESEERLCNMLEAAGVHRIDLAVFSHPHEDHIGGAAAVMENFEVVRALMPAVDNDTQLYQSLCRTAAEHGVEQITAYAGLAIDVGGICVTVLPSVPEKADGNDASTVVRITYGETSAIYTGDAGEASERTVLTAFGQEFPGCDILKVGHHGSSTSTCDDWIRALSPGYAVISCAEINDYGHPDHGVLRRLAVSGAAVYRTDTDGTVVLISDGKTVTHMNK